MKVAHTFLAIGLLVAACSTTPVSQSAIKPKNINYRLETTIEPVNYKVVLTPYLENIGTEKKEGTFDGEVIITIKVTDSITNKIKLHKHSSLKIISLLLEDATTGESIDILNEDNDNETEFYTLNLAKTLDINAIYELKFVFIGELQNNMKGFYLSTYKDGGADVKIATTQFQPTHARKAFPCFDEPHLKATFDITIIHAPEYKSISNMKQISEETVTSPAGFKRDVYATTPKMSTYLIAFIVSKFDTVGDTTENFNVYARPNAIAQGNYSYNVGKLILAKFDDYTGYKYNEMHTNMKMDMAALPDFSAGAMENWGLLTFRETALLYDEEDSTLAAKQRVATVVAHEQAHMWFGDLVTCNWWSNTWLNEGFARYFQYYATALVETSWELPNQFVTEQLQEVFAVDALDTSKPLTNTEVGSPASISAHFGSISYNKGASVIRMLEHMIGKTIFQNALKDYLKTYEFKSVVPENLFQAIQDKVPESEGLDISLIMKSWTEHPGYPIVHVKLGEQKVEVTQERFLLKTSDNDQSHKWHIPLSYTTKSVANGFDSTKPRQIFQQSDSKVELELPANEEWIIFNLGATGYYRVHYDETLLQRIVDALNEKDHSGIPALNRAQIVDDALNLARSDSKWIKYEAALKTLDYIENDLSYYPWNSAFKGLSFIRRRLTEDEHVKLFRLYVLDLLETLYKHLGFDSSAQNSHIDILNRAQILNWACSLDHKDCLEKSQVEFKKWKDSSEYKVPINIRSVVYCTAIRHGTKEDWEALYNKFKTENVAAEQVLIISALGCSKDEEILKKYLGYSLENTDIRKQDAASVFSAVYSGNQENVKVAFNFLLEHGDSIPEAYGAMNALSSAITGIAARLQTKDEIDRLEAFISSSTNLEDGKEVAEQAILAARADLKWTEDNAKEIADYFDHKINSGTALSASIFLCCLSAVAIWIMQRA